MTRRANARLPHHRYRIHVAAPRRRAAIARRSRASLEPAGVGLGYQLAELARHGLKACFFVDPMPALVFGLDPIRAWSRRSSRRGRRCSCTSTPTGPARRAGDRGATHARFELIDYSLDEQRELIVRARDLLIAAGAPEPIAFRAGSYAANDDTLTALASLGFAYDSSHNGAESDPWPSRDRPAARQIAPIEHRGVIEVPVTVIEDVPGGSAPFPDLRAVGGRDASRARSCRGVGACRGDDRQPRLRARQPRGTRPNAVHVRRFEALCAHAGGDARRAADDAFRRSPGAAAGPRRRAAWARSCCARAGGRPSSSGRTGSRSARR